MSILSELQDLPNGLRLSPSHFHTASLVDGSENHVCRQQMICRYQAEMCQDDTDRNNAELVLVQEQSILSISAGPSSGYSCRYWLQWIQSQILLPKPVALGSISIRH